MNGSVFPVVSRMCINRVFQKKIKSIFRTVFHSQSGLRFVLTEMGDVCAFVTCSMSCSKSSV